MMKCLVRTLLGVFFAVLAAFAPRPASACSYMQRAWALPTMESRVPTNTRIWVYVEDYQSSRLTVEDFTVTDDSGTSVAVRLDTIQLPNSSYGTLHVLTPLEPLKEGIVYQVAGPVETTFMVSEGPDHESPDKPEETERREYAQAAEQSCSAYSEVEIEYEPSEDLQELVVGVFDEYDTFDADTLMGTLSAVGSDVDRGDQGKMELWLGPAPVASWPRSDPKTAVLRVGMFDLAGNFSGWSEPTTIDPPPIPDGCSIGRVGQTGAGGPLVSMLLLCVFALAFRSRSIASR